MGDFFDSRVAWSGESVPRSRAEWIARNRQKLLDAFPLGEQAFCRIADKMKSRQAERSKSLLWYRRQKEFLVSNENVYFGDFYFKTFKLLVEIDGGSHSGPAAAERDAIRTALIGTHQIEVLRFWNDEVCGGDFRAVERRLIDSIACGRGMRSERRMVVASYESSRADNPHIYHD